MTCDEQRYDFGPGCDRAAILERLGSVLDPELDEPILTLGFVRSLRVRGARASVALQLPTAWCAANFVFLMAQDVRRALLSVPGVREVRVDLGEHFAAREIEAAVNAGASFARGFPHESRGGLEALRDTFLRKGFITRRERLVRSLAAAGLTSAEMCALRVADLEPVGDACSVRLPDRRVPAGAWETASRFLSRRLELGLDRGPGAALLSDADGQPMSPARLEAQRRAARLTVVSLEANGAFCRALLDTRRAAARP